jgi:hypothetical protein
MWTDFRVFFVTSFVIKKTMNNPKNGKVNKIDIMEDRKVIKSSPPLPLLSLLLNNKGSQPEVRSFP